MGNSAIESILGLRALDCMTQTQCLAAIGPLVEVRSWWTFNVNEIEEEEDEIETRNRNKGKVKDEVKEKEENLDQGEEW